MSASIPPVLIVGSPTLSTGSPTTTRDQLVAGARDLPDLILRASFFDPELAKKWTGEALLSSRTVWGTLATMAVSWIVQRYGLGWDPDTCALVSGGLVMMATIALRLITSLPITGVLSPATPEQIVDKLPGQDKITP